MAGKINSYHKISIKIYTARDREKKEKIYLKIFEYNWK